MGEAKKRKHLIAIDEAGRGPLAGPIAVAAVFSSGSKTGILKGIKDSKKLSAGQRERWLVVIKRHFEYKVAMVGPAVIDKIGINKAAGLGISRLLSRFDKKPDLVLLDGSLYAPKVYKQRTIIRGDEKIPLISAASVAAKVTRDKRMLRLNKIYPEYFFDRHKGYGTKAHYAAIKKNGVSIIHRRSFLRNLAEK